jgi:hypothetical protein
VETESKLKSEQDIERKKANEIDDIEIFCFGSQPTKEESKNKKNKQVKVSTVNPKLNKI